MPTCEKYPESDGPVDDSQDTQKDDKSQDPKGCVRIRVNIRMPAKTRKNLIFCSDALQVGYLNLPSIWSDKWRIRTQVYGTVYGSGVDAC